MEYLKGLIGKFENEATSNPEALLEYAEQMENFFTKIPDPTELETYLGLTFPTTKHEGSIKTKKGLVGFIARRLDGDIKSFEKVIEKLFGVIQYILVQRAWRKATESFCTEFKKVTDIYWHNPKVGARLQQAALDCLILLFDNYGSKDKDDLIEWDASTLYVELLRLSEKSTYQPTVRGKMFHLMGIIGYLGHGSFMQQDGYFSQLFNHILSTVTRQVKSGDAHLEVSILHGCIKGLNHILKVFHEKIDVKNEGWLNFQEHLHQIVDPSLSIVKGPDKNPIKRREFQRAALELVANHGELLQEGLFRKYRLWFEDLMMWAKSNNADDNRIGRTTVDKFLKIVIVQYPNQFKANANEEQQSRLDSLYNYFSEQFKNVLNTKNANKVELSVSVQGFGLLSNLCSNRGDSLEMFNLIMVQVDSIIHELDSPVVDKYSGSMQLLPTYLRSIASIFPSLSLENESTSSGIPEGQLESIKKLAVLLIRFFPDLNYSLRQNAHISMQNTCDALWDHHHEVCESFIEQVYQQSLLHIVSCPTRAEIDILVDSWNRSHPESKKSALSQLGLKPVQSYVHFWKFLNHGTSSSHELRFDLLVQWILDTVGKLNLTISFDETESPDSSIDPVESASAEVVKDFQIFVNIVDFMQEMMKDYVLHQKFAKWVSPFCYEIMGYVKKNTFVSGFYKMLSIVFDVARSIYYFDQETLEVRTLDEKLKGFFHNLGTKIQEFKDDLLFAVLELWLSLPDKLILTNCLALNNTLKTVFTVGRSSFPLAIKGLEAMERWFFQKEFPVDQITIIMNSIFPIFKTYFIMSENLHQEEAKIDEPTIKSKSGNLKKLIKKNVQASKKDDDPTLKDTQLKILQLIGSFGQFINLEDKGHSELSKDSRCLLYTVPFQDCKPELHIDDLLPRVLELCEHAVERQTRVSACEFFHTLSLIFIGKSTSRETEKGALFRQIFHNILKLGSDTDIVVRQLFNPLCLQTVHWFSKRNSPYAEMLVDVLIDNLTQNEDMNRRELAALSIGEYFRWCLKHQTGSSYDNQPKFVLKSLFAMGTHASPTFRQGSVMAFNSIYRDLREETTLTSKYSFNLLFSFLTSLKLSKNLPDDSLLVTSTKRAIKHLERIFNKMKDRFNTALSRKFQPTNGVTDTPCLKDVVNWLVSQAGSDATQYRLECLRLIEVLCPLIKDVSTVERFLTMRKGEHGIEGWIEIAEGFHGTADSENVTGSSLLSFLEASSTFYAFLYKHHGLTNDIFSDTSKSTFLKKLLLLCTMPQEQFSEDENLRVIEIFSRIKYVWFVLEDQESLGILWMYSLKLSKNLTGFTSLDVIDSLCQVWCAGDFPESAKQSCVDLLVFDPVTNVTSTNGDQLVNSLKQSTWHRDLAECGFMSKILDLDTAQQLRDRIWQSIIGSLFDCQNSSGTQVRKANNLSSNQIKLLENYLAIVLRLSLKSGDNFVNQHVVEAVFDSSSVSFRDGAFQLVSSKGEIFQKHLMNGLLDCRQLYKFKELLQERPIKDVGDFIQRLLRLMKSNIRFRKCYGERVVDQVIKNWKTISVNCDANTTLRIFSGLLAINCNTCRDSNEISTWWSGPYLLEARHLDLKQKAEAFGFVTVFMTSRKKTTTETITKTISYVVNTLFQPDQNWTDVESYVTYMFRKILKVFEHPDKSIQVLESVLKILVKLTRWTNQKTDHSFFRSVRDCLERTIKVSCQTDMERVNLVSSMYTLIASAENKDKGYTETASVWKCLLNGISLLSLPATKNFYKRHIYEIVKKMVNKPKNVYEWMAKTVSVSLLELLVYQTNEEFVKSKELADAYVKAASPEEKAKLDSESTEERIKIVYKKMVETCIGGVTKSDPIPIENEELRRMVFHCHQACFNTLVTTLLVTNANLKLLEGFIFRPKGQMYRKLVDDSVPYEFPIYVDEEKHKRGITFNKSKTTGSNVLLENKEIMDFLPLSGNLTGSSLAPEATMYDFTTSVTVANSEFYQRIFASANQGGVSVNSSGGSPSDKLEWNEINDHPCMLAFVETLKKVYDYHLKNKELPDASKPRNWPDLLVEMLTNEDISNSIKTFIVGGILNTPESVEPFAKNFVNPILQLVVNDCFGRIKLNHFVQDVLITLVSWHEQLGGKPEDNLITDVLKYFLDGVRNEEIHKRKDMFRHILAILQNIVQYWVGGQNDTNVIPWKEIEEFSNHSNPFEDIESTRIKLKVCRSIFLGGQHPPPEEVGKYAKYFAKCITCNKLKEVRVVGAECAALLLKLAEGKNLDFIQMYIAAVAKKLQDAMISRQIVFVELLHAIQTHFPKILTHLRNRILELLHSPKLRPESILILPLLLKQQLAEILSTDESVLNNSPSLPNPIDEFYTDIESRGLLNQSCVRDDCLNGALELFELLVEHCSQPSRLLNMVDWLTSAQTSHDSSVRARYANCLTKLYDKLVSEAISTRSQAFIDPKTRQSFMKIYIQMYSDENEQVLEAVNNFWRIVLREWDQTADLILELLDLIGFEERPLNVLLGLILQRCCLSPDHSKLIYTEPLDECQFIPFELDTSWRLQNSSFQPLFAESLSSMKNFGTLPRAIQSSLFSQKMSVSKFGMNVLRATLANLQFTPTQQQSLGQDSMNSENAHMMDVDQPSSFYINSSQIRPAQRVPSGSSLNSQEGQNSGSGSIGNPILKLRKKFYAQKDNTYFAIKGTEIRVQRSEEAREVQKSRASGVKTMRKYRIGELPDILIKNSDVLNTLVKLAKQDEDVARQFLRLLFQGMVDVLSLPTDSKKVRGFLSKSKDVFERVLRNTLILRDRALSALLLELSTLNYIKLPTNVVLDVCKTCNLQSLGILTLEHEFKDGGHSSSTSSKRSRQAFKGQPVENRWIGLAELYKEIEEYDVLRNIFGNTEIATTDETRKEIYRDIGKALHSEGQDDLLGACQIFQEVITKSDEEDLSVTASIFLHDSYLNCMAKLGNWDTLYDDVTRNFDSVATEDIFENQEFVERFMPMQMLSGMQLVLRRHPNFEIQQTKFNKFMEHHIENVEGLHFLETNYAFDAGTWALIVQDKESDMIPWARYFLDQGYENVIRKLRNVNSLPLKAQRETIVVLQKSSILNDYCKWESNSLKDIESSTDKLFTAWNKSLDHQPLDLMGNNLIASYRDGFLSKILRTLEERMEEDELALISHKTAELMVDQEIWLANLGSLHRKYSVTHRSLTRLLETQRTEVRALEFRKSFATSLAVFESMFGPKAWCKKWCKSWQLLDEQSARNDMAVYLIKMELLCSVSNMLKNLPTEESLWSFFYKMFGGTSRSTLASNLLQTAQSLRPVDQSDCGSEQNASLFNKLFFVLQKLTEVTEEVSDAVSQSMLTCILRGCTEQGKPSEMLFLSSIFPMLNQFSELHGKFESLSVNVPSFLFLPWLDQIVTTYRRAPKEYDCFKGLINRLVNDFPRAFQLQYPEYLDECCRLFSKAFKAVVLPHKMHDKMISNFNKADLSDEARSSQLKEFQLSLQDIINSNTIYGELHCDYAREMFEVVNRVVSELPSSGNSTDSMCSSSSHGGLTSESWNSARREMNKIHKMREKTELSRSVINLEKFSPFLAKFHFFENGTLEKPGLYENFRKPNLQEHPLIVSFHPTVKRFTSITKPIRLTIVTNDGKKCNFLSKLGDDLRQDRRIQQLFKMSNVLFENDISVKKRNLALDTYSCIPITCDFGLIEMIGNVKSLLDVMLYTDELKNIRSNAFTSYEKWLRQNATLEHKSLHLGHYVSAADRTTREQTEGFFRELRRKFPEFLFSDQIMKRCSSLHDFFHIRQNMIKSYGALCMVHWLLGIGDRHLDNCLLSLTTGKIVGIDFGRAFGTANFALPIPELIPFRLTPQLQNLMRPYSFKGLFRESCILAWNCLVENSEMILTVANVFILEPTIDWQKLRESSKYGQEEDAFPSNDKERTTDEKHFPFDIMKRKLLGHNPVNLTLDELKMHDKPEVTRVYSSIVKDRNCGDTVLPTEQYVDILLDLATDNCILGREYAGWTPWL